MAALAPGAEAAIRVAGRLPHAHTGRAAPLEGWERLIFRERYMAEPGSVVVTILPRGHVKTSNSAKLVVLDLLQTDTAAAFMAATSIAQAEEMYRHASHYARLVGPDPDGRPRIKVSGSTYRLTRPDGGFARVLASDLSGLRTGKAQGFAPTFAALDEFQAWRALSMFIDLQTALFKRGGIMLITGLPADRGHPLRSMRDTALGARVETGLRALPDGSTERHPDGRLTIARADMLIWLEWGLGPDEDWRDPDVCKLANPASWITPSGLSRDLVTPGVPDWAQRTMRACQWIDVGALEWLPPDVVDGLAIGDPILLDGFQFALYSDLLRAELDARALLADAIAPYAGRDDDAPARVPDDDERASLLATIEAAQSAKRARVEQEAHVAKAAAEWANAVAGRGRVAATAVDMGRYRDTSAIAAITVAGDTATLHAAVIEPSPDKPTPYAAVDILVFALQDAGAEVVGWDPKYLDRSAGIWEARGVKLQQLPQSTDRQITQSRALRDALVSGALRSDGNPAIAEHARNVRVQNAGVGWKIARGRGPIDAIVAAAMAWDLYCREPEDEPVPWIG